MRLTIKILLTLTAIFMIGIYACDGGELSSKLDGRVYTNYTDSGVLMSLTFSSNKLKMYGDGLAALAGLLVDYTLLKNVDKNKSIYSVSGFGLTSIIGIELKGDKLHWYEEAQGETWKSADDVKFTPKYMNTNYFKFSHNIKGNK
ncbi:hypothetical protein [Brachyspira sp.]|uniref:hypothetical protein n=1 Tax=Brachyspira sp. TaxID=1977261 RepID=UPI003D7D73AE